MESWGRTRTQALSVGALPAASSVGEPHTTGPRGPLQGVSRGQGQQACLFTRSQGWEQMQRNKLWPPGGSGRERGQPGSSGWAEPPWSEPLWVSQTRGPEGAVRGPGPCEGGVPHAPLGLVGGCSPGTPGTPTLSLYLLEAGFRAPAGPGGPRPCFRSCMETSWLAVRDRAAPWNTGGSPHAPPHPRRGARRPALPRVVPWGAALPPAAQTPAALSVGARASGPGLQWPRHVRVFLTVMGRL